MILGKRQIEFGTASVPDIKRATEIDVKGYESIVEAFTEALMGKMSHYYRNSEFRDKSVYKDMISVERAMFKDCIEQAITFLNLWISLNTFASIFDLPSSTSIATPNSGISISGPSFLLVFESSPFSFSFLTIQLT